MTEWPPKKRRSGIPKMAAEADYEATETKTRTSIAAAPPSARDRAFLLVIAGEHLGEMYPLKEPEIILGRGHDATIQLPDDDGVSRRHAKLICHGSEVQIEDLGSANGTIVNGTTLDSVRVLKDGDKIALGSTTVLKFTYSDDLEEDFQRQMLEAALRDGLTKLFNKKYFMERLDAELAFAGRHRTPLSLIMLDVDHFKRINDTFGHPTGDAVLVRLAGIMVETARKEDVLARYGGEEFVILCRGVNVTNAGVLAERLRERIAVARLDHDGQTIAVTVSLGVAGYPDVAAKTCEELLSATDDALYAAKSAGRNRVVTGKI
jgi:diguanylate cyclase (GGDEF)-like protein